jgi:RNA-directed DNA polymerase
LQEEILTETKPFNIPKKVMWQAYKLVKANKGSAGVDQQSLEDFEKDLANNLYKLWNRLSSGSYFPPPVKACPIPKKSGGERILGIPAVSDRIAQMVIKLQFEPLVEVHFLEDSYGYRPNKSALEAVGVTQERCRAYDWVLEFDIVGLFDNIPHNLLQKAIEVHTDCRYTKLYLERWLKAPLEMANGEFSREEMRNSSRRSSKPSAE